MVYTGNSLREIVFPLGGIGTGSVGLAGNGCFVDWEIFNRPNKGSLNKYSCFAVKAEYPDGRSVTKILQGDWEKDLTGSYSKIIFGGYGFGPERATMCGFPHFRSVKFDGKFPIATLTFEDEAFPAKVVLKAFNPFIPLDADHSSIPAAFFEIKITSQSNDIQYTVVLSASNPFECSENQVLQHGNCSAVKMVHHGKSSSDLSYGDMTIATDSPDSFCQEYWYRGDWQDPIITFWHDLTTGTLKSRHYGDPGHGDTCSVGARATIGQQQSRSFRFVLAWNVPNCYNYWDPCLDADGNHMQWKNYYTTLFADSAAAGFYCLDNWNWLYRKTNRFCRSLHSATLDKAVIDAVSSTLSVLKTPTVLRLEDGTFYGWEGINELAGSCEGTCTHVWSYAYALSFLFPELERSLRDTEFRYDTDEKGRMYFRTALPLGRGHVVQPPCVDGQMATIIKIYRDWKLTGNSQWLHENWHNIQKVLEYAWSDHNDFQWDKDKDGVLEGRQHHTLDMELFGPSAWLQGMYLCALKAAAEIADYFGESAKSAEYRALFENGYRFTKENLFNGQYFYHKVDLADRNYTEHFQCPNYWNEEHNQLKYQIGDGCGIDQMLGQWHANICGLGDIFDKAQRQTALKSMWKNNFKSSLRNFANTWLVFALNDESGVVMCDYPEDACKPVIPIPYSEECMSGFEYAFAGLLISEGFLQEGLSVIRAIRNRYDGKKRNPWNEFECGSNYARPMSSFALLPIFCGFTFDLPHHKIGFSPILPGDFQCFWSVGTAWGDYIGKSDAIQIVIHEGFLDLQYITLKHDLKIKAVHIDGKPVDFRFSDDTLAIPLTKVRKRIVITL